MEMSRKVGIPLLLSVAVMTCILIGPAIGQQNGELYLRGGLRDRQTGSQTNQLLATNLEPANYKGQIDDPSAAKIQYVNVNGLPVLVQFTYVGPPKILPIATADSYPEGSSINLICTVSGGQRTGLSLKWAMNGEELSGEKMKYSESMENVSIGGDDADISFLKIKNATYANSGKYTCTATNPLGQDSTSVNIIINGILSWGC